MPALARDQCEVAQKRIRVAWVQLLAADTTESRVEMDLWLIEAIKQLVAVAQRMELVVFFQK
jgi:hypothetical protein